MQAREIAYATSQVFRMTQPGRRTPIYSVQRKHFYHYVFAETLLFLKYYSDNKLYTGSSVKLLNL